MTKQIRLVKSIEEFSGLEKTWNDLLSASPSDNFFLRWEWLWNWWQVYSEKSDELAIFLLFSGNEITGIAPFYVRKKLLGGLYPVKRMMFLSTQESGEGDVGSDYMDIIYMKGNEDEFVHLIFELIVRQNLCDEIYLSKIDNTSATFSLFQKEAGDINFLKIIANEFVSPYIELPSTWEDYLNSLSSTMRYKIRNERRKLTKFKNIIFRKAESETELNSGFDEIVRLHQQRWKSRGMRGAFSHDKFLTFHSRIIPAMKRNGHLELILVSEDDQTRGAIYNFLYRNKIYFYQSGIDTNATKAAFGYLLHSYCIEEAIKRGMDEYDFLPKGGTDDYKDRFSNKFRKLSDIYLARDWKVKYFIKAKESARSVYHQVKPYLQKANL